MSKEGDMFNNALELLGPDKDGAAAAFARAAELAKGDTNKETAKSESVGESVDKAVKALPDAGSEAAKKAETMRKHQEALRKAERALEDIRNHIKNMGTDGGVEEKK